MALLSLTVMVGSCVGSDSLTGTGGEAALGIQPALIPTPADGDALPINRIRISVARVPDGLLVGQSTVAVEPTDDSWSVDVSVPEPFSATTVRVFVWLLNVASDGTESVQFSGRSDPMELVPGEALEPDVPIVRGPLANLLATSVSIASVPTTMAEGSTATLTADVTTSGTETPTVYWTSLDPSVVSMSGAVATAVAGGTARVVASAGSFADTASIQVFPNLSITTASLPEGTQGTAYSQALAATGGDGSYTWSVTAGSLPSGLSLAAGTGAISGTPTTVEASSFTAQVTSGDGQTATLALGITVRDDAAPAFGVAESGGTTVVDESGTTDSFDLVLLAQPVTDVVLTVTNADTTEATVTPSTLTFTNATWDTPQSVTVTGVDDTAPDGDQVTDVTVSVDAASSDDPFDGLPAQTVSVTTTDDDLGAPGLTLNRWTGAGDGVQWIDPNNWSTGAVPVATDSVVIDADGDYSIVAVSGSVAYLTVGAASGTQTLALQGGTLSIDSAAVFEASSVYNHTDGTLTGPGDVTFRGGFTWSQGVITGTGAMTIEPGATATWGFAAKTLDGRTITNDGTVDLYETVVMTNGAVLINNGALNIPAATGSSGLTGGSSGTLVNNGTIVKTSGATNQIQPAFVNNGTLEVQFATLQFSGEFTHAAGALLRGNATVDLSAATVLDFSGEVAPGTSPGTLQIVPPAAGLVTTSSSSLTMEVGGTTPGSAYDVLTIPGIVTLAGDLLVDTINAFVPTGGDRFALMTFAGRAGDFASVTLPTIDGITLDTAWAEAGTTDTLYVVASSAGPANLVTWTGGGDGSSWSDGSNWSSGGAPTAGDSVVIQGATTSNINLDVDADVQSLVITGAGGASQVLSASGANLRASADILVEAAAGINMGPGDTISSGGQITVTDVAVLELAGSTVDGALDLQGGLGVHNASTLTGPLTTAATATIVIEGFSTEATLTIPAGFTNNGLIDLTDGEIGNATLSVQGTLVNNGTIRALPGVSGSSQRFLYAVLDNRATLEVSQTLTLAANSGTHRNSGTISVTDQIFTLTLNQASFTNESAGTIQLTGNGDLYVYYPNTGTPSFGQAGTITIGDGRNLLLSGAAGSFDITGGSITNNGVLDIGAVPAINAPAFAQSGSGVLRLNTTTWNGSGPLTNPPGATLDLRGAVINADVVNRGNVLTYSGIINGRLTVPNTEVATFTTPSTPYGVQAQGLDIDGAVFDRATLAVNGTDIVQMSNVTFQNQDVSTTQLQVTHTGAGSPFTLDNVAFGATTNAYIGATDTTPVDADTLTIILTNSTPADGSANTTTSGGAVVYWGAPPAALNTWTGAAGDALWSTPANWSGGVPAANDSVVIDLSSTSVILDQDAAIQSLQLGGGAGSQLLDTNGFDLSTAADINVVGGGDLTVSDGGIVTPGGAMTVTSSLNLDGGSIAGSLDLQGASVTVRGTSGVAGAVTADVDAVLSVVGSTELGDAGLTVTGDYANEGIIYLTDTGPGQAILQAATLFNTGTLYSQAGTTGSQRVLAATLDNQGAVEVASNINVIGDVGTNNGTMNVTAGTLQIFATGTTFVNEAAGQMTASGAGVISTALFSGGTFTNQGSFDIGTGGGLHVNSGGTFDMSTGSLTNSGFILVSTEATVLTSSPWTNTATLNVDSATWNGPSVTNAAGGTMNFWSGGTVAGDFTNQGAANIAEGWAVVTGDVDANAAAITGAASTFLEMSGSGVTVQGALPGLLVSGTATLFGNTSVTGDVTVQGSGATLTIDQPTLSVGGGLTTSSGGSLVMTDALGTVDVAGAADFGGAPSSGLLTAGTLRVAGDFTAAADAFSATLSHTTLLDGTGLQRVDLVSGSQFADLDIVSNSGGISLNSPIDVSGTFIAGGTTVSGNGTVTASFLNVDGTIFDGVPLALVTANPKPPFALSNATFQNMPVDGVAYLSITDPGGTDYSISGLTFAPLLQDPNTSFYLRVTDSAADGQPFSVTISTDPENGPVFTDRIGTGADTPDVIWSF